jgi:uncharacterized membrane protein
MARESQRLRRASRGRGEAEENGRQAEEVPDRVREEADPGSDDSGGGLFSTLKDVATDAALAVLTPVAKKGATKAAKFAVEKGPELFEDKVLPKLDQAGGPMGLVQDMASGGGVAGSLLSKVTGGDDDGGDRGTADGTGKGRRMPIQQAVDVAAPVEIVYDQFTEFEEFPKFMHRVESVEQKDDAHVVFHEKVWGFRRNWEAEIVEQRPDERIVWESVSGLEHVGVVTFHELAERLTRIELNIDIDPSGPIEKIARGARFAKRAARADLKRFKAYVEMQEEDTDGWRGEIEDGEVVTEPEEYEEQERSEDEPEAEYEEEPEAEYEEEEEAEEPEEEPEAEEADEPEAEAEAEEPEEEPEPEEEEQPAGRRRSSSTRSRSRSSSNGSSKSESAAPKRSRGGSRSSAKSKPKSSASKSSSSRSRGSSSKSRSSSSGSRSGSSKSKSSSGGGRGSSSKSRSSGGRTSRSKASSKS